MPRKIVGIIGGRSCTDKVERLAQNLGRKLAKVADILVCGGLSGTMKAVSSGFKASGGLTIGIIPSYNKKDANKYIDIVIPTGLGLARNVLVVKTADVVVALPGAAGTLSEIAYCLQFGIPVLSLYPPLKKYFPKGDESLNLGSRGFNSWDIPGVIKVKSVDEAVRRVRKELTR